jgi:hypothetical protein
MECCASPDQLCCDQLITLFGGFVKLVTKLKLESRADCGSQQLTQMISSSTPPILSSLHLNTHIPCQILDNSNSTHIHLQRCIRLPTLCARRRQPRVRDIRGVSGSLGDIANIIMYGLSVYFVAALTVFSSQRKAALGEFPALSARSRYIVFTTLPPFQRSHRLPPSLPSHSPTPTPNNRIPPPTRLQSPRRPNIHPRRAGRGNVLGITLVATQVVEDGTLSSLIVRSLFFVWLMES